jgi:hypothetical protein
MSPPRSFKMDEGTLTVGPVGTEHDMSCQVANARVEWTENTTDTDAVPVLCGDELPADSIASYTAVLAGNVVQDLEALGTVAYSWTNMGEELEFTLQPRNDTARAVTGICRIVPITLGGDVRVRNRSDFSWACVGYPQLVDVVVAQEIAAGGSSRTRKRATAGS